MILRPAVRFLMSPRPPADFAARRLAAVMRPPLVFFMVAPFVLGWDMTMGAKAGAVCAQSHV